jgi:conjugal transfer/entry exclusion protein
MRRFTLLVAGGLWLMARAVQGQGVPVYDNTNFLQNVVTAAESTITAIESVLQTANQVLELTPVDEVIVGGQMAEDMAALAEIVTAAELIWYDVHSVDAQIMALFGLDNAPATRDGLDERVLEIKQFYHRTLTFAMRTQTLIKTLLRTAEHVRRLIESLGDLVGNMQGNQTLIQTNATMSQTLAVMEAQQAAWQRADTVQRLSQGVILESLRRIDESRWESWPRY